MSGKNNNFPKRGEIYWVNLDPAVGSETKKTRPALIVSNDSSNAASGIVIIAPITSKIKRIFSFEAKVDVNGTASKIMLNQCRTVDKSRLGKKLTSVDEDVMKLVEDAIKVAFGLS